MRRISLFSRPYPDAAVAREIAPPLRSPRRRWERAVDHRPGPMATDWTQDGPGIAVLGRGAGDDIMVGSAEELDGQLSRDFASRQWRTVPGGGNRLSDPRLHTVLSYDIERHRPAEGDRPMVYARPPRYCQDCGRVVSASSTRCRRCATRYRLLEPNRTEQAQVSTPPMAPVTTSASPVLTEEEIRWIQTDGFHLRAEDLAERFRVPLGAIHRARTVWRRQPGH